MTSSRRLLLAILLVVAACGDDSTASTTTTTTTDTTTTTVATSTTTTAPEGTGPLAGLLTAPVEDPFFDTGFHTMQYVDDTEAYLVSQDLLGVPGGESARLAIGLLDPAPVTAGVADDQKLVATWIDNWSGDIAPTGAALYTLGADGWGVYAAITDTAVLAFLETTTDFNAKKSADPHVVLTTLTAFDWAGGTAHFIAGVAAFDYLDAAAPVYQGQIECSLAASLDCVLLSDDGVLRPGDEGEGVSTLQSDLAAIGYFPGAVNGTYDDATEEAVRLFQRDYRLGVDGKAGPSTLGLLADVVGGESDIVLASQDGLFRHGVANTSFGTLFDPALSGLTHLFGNPDSATGWYADACDGHQWYRATWDGFTAIFTDRDGPKQFDGWAVDDLSDLPSRLYFAGGIRPSWTWEDFAAMGAGFDPSYGAFWYDHDLGYNNGRFVHPPSDPPAADAEVKGFGTGTGGFVSC
ncbi:MAG TPA: peptidoglycan-binding domain-containing protein [Acidimicrobiia bacterium]